MIFIVVVAAAAALLVGYALRASQANRQLQVLRNAADAESNKLAGANATISNLAGELQELRNRGRDPDEKLRGIDANPSSAPWNVVRDLGAQRYNALFTLRREETLALPHERWKKYPPDPVFPSGLVEDIASLVESGAHVAIVGDSRTGKSVLQFAVHRALRVPNAIAVHDQHHVHEGEIGPLTTTFKFDSAPEQLPEAVRVVSWYDFSSCGHLFRLFHDAPTICTTGREKLLISYWLAGRGGTVTVPNPVVGAGEAYFDLTECFPFVAAFTTHIVTLYPKGRDAHVYRLYESA